MKRTLSLLGFLAVLASSSAALADSAAHEHDGFFLRLAPGFAYVHDGNTVSFGNQSADATLSGFGGAFELSLGGTVAPGLVIGGTVYGTSFPSPKVTVGGNTATGNGSLVHTAIGPMVDYYFDPSQGLHLGGMIGYSTAYAQDNDDNRTSNTAKGFMVGAHFGDEWFVSDEWSIGVMGRLSLASVKDSTDGIDDKHFLVVPMVLASFTYH